MPVSKTSTSSCSNAPLDLAFQGLEMSTYQLCRTVPRYFKMYFIAVDAHSKWPEEYAMSQATTVNTIAGLWCLPLMAFQSKVCRCWASVYLRQTCSIHTSQRYRTICSDLQTDYGCKEARWADTTALPRQFPSLISHHHSCNRRSSSMHPSCSLAETAKHDLTIWSQIWKVVLPESRLSRKASMTNMHTIIFD